MEEKVFVKFDKYDICGVLNSPTKDMKECVLIMHGFSSNKDKGAKNIQDVLTKHHIHSIRIDFDDFGESTFPFFEASVNYLKEKGYENVSLVGTSFGGAVAIALASEDDNIKRIFLRAPLSNPKELHLEKYGAKLVDKRIKEGSFDYVKGNGSIHKLSAQCYTDAYSYDLYSLTKKIQCPVFIAHGTDDKEVPLHQSEKLVSYCKEGELLIIEGAGHNLGVGSDFSKGQEAIVEFLSRTS
jgi:pimeloyl-ACP methyl ester carboxylesterase